MKIIHLILGKANPNRMNGVNKVVYSLATKQHELGYDVEVWGISEDQIHNYPFRSFNTQLFKKYKNPFKIGLELKNRIQLEKATFHLHGGFVPQYYLLSKIIVESGNKYVFTSHGSYNKEALKKSRLRKKIYFQLFENSVVKKAHVAHFIGISEYNHVTKLIKKRSKILVPNGQEIPSQIYPVKGDKLIFGFCGRIKIHVKGLDLLLAGYAKFLANNEQTNSELWIIGDGDELQKLIDLVRVYKLEKQVVLYGAKYGEEKNQLIAQMDVFCHTSRYEGLPTAVLEAASLGIPSIVSKETNMGDYLINHQAGFVLKENNTSEISYVFEEAFKRKDDVDQYAKNAKQMIQDVFSWEHIVKQLAPYYI